MLKEIISFGLGLKGDYPKSYVEFPEITKLTWHADSKWAFFFFSWSFPHYRICPVLLNQLVYLVEQRLHTDSNYRVCPSFKLVCEVLVIRTPNKQVEG